MIKKLFDKYLDKIIYFTFLFFTGAFIGGIIEISFIYLTENELVFGGFMYLLWRPMYGWALIVLEIVLNKYKNSKLLTFIFSMIFCTCFEYITGVALKVLFHQEWWNYSNNFLNFQGLICLSISIGWGVLGVIYNFFISNIINKIYTNISPKTINIILLFLIFVYKIDEIFSFIKVIN